MVILITGGTGLIGRPLTQKLCRQGHEVRILTRSEKRKENEFYWNVADRTIDDAAFQNLDCIIHLAGASVSKRWTKKYRRELHSSRIDSANLLHEYCLKHKVELKSFVSASGINYYGTFTSARILKEDDGIIKHDFLADLCQKWESAALQFEDVAERITILRTGLVLAKNGGALEPLAKLADYHLASPIGTGKQWMSWIHIEDMVNMYAFAVENTSLHGAFNAVADEPVRNRLFMKKLAHSRRKFFLPIAVPSFLFKIIFGEMSDILLKGSRIDNAKIIENGFEFKYNTLKDALENLS